MSSGKSQRAKGGRPSRLSAEVQRKIVLALRSGNARVIAARFAGIAPATFFAWMKRGAAARRGRWADFHRAVIDAETQCEMQMVGVVIAKAATDVKQAKWWLTHKARKRWGDNQPQKVELSGPKGGPIKVEDARASLESRLAALAAKRSAKGTDPEPE